MEGLTSLQAKDRLEKFGRNDLPQEPPLDFVGHLLRALKEPMLILLIIIATLYLILGDLTEGLMLGTSALMMISIALYQERKSERALAELRDLASPRAIVVRDGSEKRIASVEVVPDDIVILNEGDRVPADGIVQSGASLIVDESLLTGESVPVTKNVGDRVYSSTLTVGGSGTAIITETGAMTEVGKIGVSLRSEPGDDLNLNYEIRKLVKTFAFAGLFTSIAVAAVLGFAKHDWLNAILTGLATQIALLPEEFPVVLTVFMALGAWRLSKVQVLVRRPISIERLGAVTTLCVDKTGTLTKNEMTVSTLRGPSPNDILKYSSFSCHPNPFDPMEKAIISAAKEKSISVQGLSLEKLYPISAQLLAMACVWKSPDGRLIVALKGAPEAIAKLCGIDPVNLGVESLASEGLRVLGVARADWSSDRPLPDHISEFEAQFVGLIGLEDPLRPEVPRAVDICQRAGIRVLMMTGDFPETAKSIAKKAGLLSKNIILGSEIVQMSDLELRNRLIQSPILARMSPDAKLRVVKLLKEQGQIVAMTGDGINDAPSLKWANVGISMGLRGTDVAREASAIVLLDDNFASIVSGIERGRAIFSNIKRALAYIVSIHVPIAGLAALPVFLKWPSVLLPVHIVLLELIIDPVCSLMFEAQPVDADLMMEKPRKLSSNLLSLKDIFRCLIQGGLVLTTSILMFIFMPNPEKNPDLARTLAFSTLVVGNLALIFGDLSPGSWIHFRQTMTSRTNLSILISICLGLVLLTEITVTRSLLHFTRLDGTQWALIFSSGFLIFSVTTLWNRLAQLRTKNITPN